MATRELTMRKLWLFLLVGIPGGIALAVPVAWVLGRLGLPAIPERDTLFRYGATALPIVCLVVGGILSVAGIAICKRFLRLPPLWSAPAIGGVYGAGVYLLAMFVPLGRGTPGGIFFAAWLIAVPVLAPAIFVAVLGSWRKEFDVRRA